MKRKILIIISMLFLFSVLLFLLSVVIIKPPVRTIYVDIRELRKKNCEKVALLLTKYIQNIYNKNGLIYENIIELANSEYGRGIINENSINASSLQENEKITFQLNKTDNKNMVLIFSFNNGDDTIIVNKDIERLSDTEEVLLFEHWYLSGVISIQNDINKCKEDIVDSYYDFLDYKKYSIRNIIDFNLPSNSKEIKYYNMWLSKVVNMNIVDKWNKKYQVKISDKVIIITSAGRDSVFGNADDIILSKQL